MAPATSYRIRFTADPVQLMLFRGGLDRWLDELCWPESERVDALLAVSEACCNTVQHAYTDGEPGDVEVTGRLVLGPVDRRVRWVVRDHGRWQPAVSSRGFGLTTVRACMEKVTLRPDATGTVLTMTSRPVPLVDLDLAGAPTLPHLRAVSGGG